jgi:zinc and cadmium transporter
MLRRVIRSARVGTLRASLGWSFLAAASTSGCDGPPPPAALDAGVGTSVFLAILFHKVPSSFSLAAILLHERYTRRSALLLSTLFPLAIPLGAGLYFVLADFWAHESFGPPSLAFSAGSFLHLATADLLPDLHRQKAKRLPLSAALLLGVAVMWALSVFGPVHGHG